MAYQTPVAEWLAERRHKFELKLNEFRWGKSLSIPIYDIGATLRLGGKVAEGRGTATNELLALEKACAEAIERLVCQTNFLSTEGVALHTQEPNARENARLEALERFLFSWHRERKIAFDFLPTDCDEAIHLQQWVTDLSPKAKLEIRLMKAPTGYFSPICKISEGDNLFIGLSCGADLEDTCEKALIEAIRNLAAQKANPVSYSEALTNNPDLWCGDSKFINELLPLFDSKSSNSMPPILEVISERLSTKSIGDLEDCPVFVERAWVQRGSK
jgi:ribosomal protein S12 methylthiotransferase accessory factor YcaO